jgi:hypothetical protein
MSKNCPACLQGNVPETLSDACCWPKAPLITPSSTAKTRSQQRAAAGVGARHSLIVAVAAVDAVAVVLPSDKGRERGTMMVSGGQ